jgi:hypothetical protein
MPMTKNDMTTHPTESQLADYLGGTLSVRERTALTDHIGSCSACLAKVVAAHEAVSGCAEDRGRAKRKTGFVKKLNFYLIGAIITFGASFILPRYFIQLLVATLILGMKWITDSRTTKMLVMIHEAWKKGGEKEASKILETFDAESRKTR